MTNEEFLDAMLMPFMPVEPPPHYKDWPETLWPDYDAAESEPDGEECGPLWSPNPNDQGRWR